MGYKHDLTYGLLTFFWALFVSLFAMPPIISTAYTKGLLDVPNNRTMHSNLTPRLGGIGVFAGFFSAITIFGLFTNADKGVQMLLAGVVILFFVGLKDDIVPVSVFKKFLMQVLAASIVVIFGNIRIVSLYGVLGIYGIENGLSYVLSFIVLIGLTNAVNLIDGIDGLAGSVVVFCSLCFGVCFLYVGSCYFYVSLALAGAMLGFLRYNFHKATIFMGDTGSLVSGFVLAVLSIKVLDVKITDVNMPVTSLAIVIVPVVDTLRVFAIRTLNGTSPFVPDRRHLHHVLSTLGFDAITVVGLLLLVNSALVVTVCYLSKFYSIDVLLFVLFALVMLNLCALTYVPRIFKRLRN